MYSHAPTWWRLWSCHRLFDLRDIHIRYPRRFTRSRARGRCRVSCCLFRHGGVLAFDAAWVGTLQGVHSGLHLDSQIGRRGRAEAKEPLATVTATAALEGEHIRCVCVRTYVPANTRPRYNNSCAKVDSAAKLYMVRLSWQKNKSGKNRMLINYYNMTCVTMWRILQYVFVKTWQILNGHQ